MELTAPLSATRISVMLLQIFFTALRQDCWSFITLLWKSTFYVLCNVTIPTSRRRSEFDVAVTTLYQHYHYKIHNMMYGEFTIQGRSKVETTLWVLLCSFLLYQRHYKVGCWLYDVATLPQRCHKFVCLLEHFTKISAS